MEQPLVSIVVITYNSGKYVRETLDSIKAQTYPNIELIVTDDCSRDNTVEIVRGWIEDNKSAFSVEPRLVTTPKNTGTCANLNRGVRVSHGVWIKSLAGDDKLKPECIGSFIGFVAEHPDCQFCCCDLKLFSEDGANLDGMRNLYDYFFSSVRKSYKEKCRQFITRFTIPGPGWFYSRKLYDEIGGFDESYILNEEQPFVYKALQHGYDILPVTDRLVYYRINNASVSHQRTAELGNPLLFNDAKRFYKRVRRRIMLKRGMFLTVWDTDVRYFVSSYQYKKDVAPWRKQAVKLLRYLDFHYDILQLKSFVYRLVHK